jgi:hypothetical protein
MNKTPEEIRNLDIAELSGWLKVIRPNFGTEEELKAYAVEMMMIENPEADEEALWLAMDKPKQEI